MTRPKREAAVQKLASDSLVLRASLVLSEPTVNRRQLNLAGRIIKQAKALHRTRGRK